MYLKFKIIFCINSNNIELLYLTNSYLFDFFIETALIQVLLPHPIEHLGFLQDPFPRSQRYHWYGDGRHRNNHSLHELKRKKSDVKRNWGVRLSLTQLDARQTSRRRLLRRRIASKVQSDILGFRASPNNCLLIDPTTLSPGLIDVEIGPRVCLIDINSNKLPTRNCAFSNSPVTHG